MTLGPVVLADFAEFCPDACVADLDAVRPRDAPRNGLAVRWPKETATRRWPIFAKCLSHLD